MNNKDVIVLFSGCGGFSEGFKQSGFNIIYANDNWDKALQSHKLNHPTAEHILGDIRKIKDFPSASIVIGSPPCQNFSVANPYGNHELGLELVHEFERVVEIIKPKYWVWENVPAIAKYYSNHFFLNSFDFGLAQRRNRCFVSNFTFTPPSKIQGEWTPIYQYSGTRKQSGSKASLSHTYRSGTVCAHNRVCNTETGEFLTMDEIKILMGFSLDYQLVGGVSAQQKQLGNAVCPPVAKAIAEAIRDNKVEFKKSMFDF